MTDLDRRQQILNGALQVFSTQGFHKASIKQIAKAAGIKSSALIYHYFEDKKDLLNAVVHELSPVGQVDFLKPEMQEQLLNVPPEQLLAHLAKSFLSLLENDDMRNLIRLFLSEAVRMPEVAGLLADTQKKMVDFLIRYLKHQQEIGNFREHDAEVSARTFMGIVIVKLMVTLVFVPLSEGMPETEVYINQAVQLFLNGVKQVPEK